MATVSTAHHEPAPGHRDCRECGWFQGLTGPTSDTAYCSNPKCSRVHANASTGCSCWVKRYEKPRRRAEPGDPRPEPPAWLSDHP